MSRTTAARPSTKSHAFNVIPRAEIPRSSFSRTHNVKTTFNSGYLIPFFIDECVPGDTVKLKATLFGRIATPIFPVMDNMYLDVFWFSCSERILWTNFKKMMGEQDNPADSTSYIMPVVTSPAGGFPREGLADYFGIPPQHSAGTGNATLSVRASLFRMYNRVWNTWFRDENLQNSVPDNVGNGPDSSADYVLLRRGKRKDYFTACLPWPQKGTAVVLPLGTTAPVNFSITAAPNFINRAPATDIFGPLVSTTATDPSPVSHDVQQTGVGGTLEWNGTSGLGFTAVTDLATATAATINQIRTAFQVQRLYERDARGGTRYPEQILAHFGVSSDDARQQRPEFLGGGTLNIEFNPVAKTNSSSDPTITPPQGMLAAYGTVVGGVPTIVKSFTEHSLVMGLVMVRADLNYQQGLNKLWNRSTKVDFYWPALAMLGEQAVLSKEIYLDGTAGDETVFGYQERWAEMRYKPSLITGQMRSNYPQTLDSWHLAQNFGSRPVLGNAFIVESPPVDRVVANFEEPQFILDGHVHYIHTRPMPTFSVPGLVDHL